MLKRNIYIKPIATPIDLEDVVEGCLLAGSPSAGGSDVTPGEGGGGGNPTLPPFGHAKSGVFSSDDIEDWEDEDF